MTLPGVGGEPLLRVAFDDQIFNAQLRGGISRYFVELMKRLPAQGVQPVLLSTKTRNEHLADTGWVRRLEPQTQREETWKWRAWKLTGHPRSQPRPRPRFDVLHHTFTNAAYLRGWRGPQVVTVFDMTPELFPEYFPGGNPHFSKRRYTEVVDAIITNAQSTADDIARLYSSSVLDRMHVIPLGVGDEFFEVTQDELDLPPRYLLFVGVRSGYKDFPTALAAYARLASRDPELRFVVVGGGRFTDEELGAIGAAGIGDRVIKLFPSDHEMPEIYRRASAFVFPTVYDGFGLPTLEAQAAGTPSLRADASCGREVGGTAAFYFAPGDVDGLVATIEDAMSPAGRERARIEGPRHARQFTWERVAGMSADLYRDVAARTGRSRERSSRSASIDLHD